MHIGIIGYRGHSQRLLEISLKNTSVSHVYVFCRDSKTATDLSKSNHPKKVTYTSDLSDLVSLRAIIIASDNESHVSYIKTFLDTDAYIFCEKPACINLSEYSFLKNLSSPNKSKIYFNFNLKKSVLYDELNELVACNKYGDLFNISIRLTHGLAFKPKFKQSWRSKKVNIFQSIAGNLGIHYINLLEHFLGKSSISQINLSAVSSQHVIDTAHIYSEFKEKVSSSIFLSYASPYSYNMLLTFTDAIIEFTAGTIYLSHPRDTFDKDGLFTSPTKNILKTFDKEFTSISMKQSVDYFLDIASREGQFPISDFTENIETTHTILNSTTSPDLYTAR